VILLVLVLSASLRTYYETYPKSVSDPINLVEDVRVDSFAISSLKDHLKNLSGFGTITFDYKTGLKVTSFIPSSFEPSIVTDKLSESDYFVFDFNGLNGSLHTTNEVYNELLNVMTNENLVYTTGNVVIVQSVP